MWQNYSSVCYRLRGRLAHSSYQKCLHVTLASFSLRLMRCWMEMPCEDCGESAGAQSHLCQDGTTRRVSAFLQHTNNAYVSQSHGPQVCRQHPGKTELLALSFSSVPFGKGYGPRFQAVALLLSIQTRLCHSHFQNRSLFALFSAWV